MRLSGWETEGVITVLQYCIQTNRGMYTTVNWAYRHVETGMNLRRLMQVRRQCDTVSWILDGCRFNDSDYGWLIKKINGTEFKKTNKIVRSYRKEKEKKCVMLTLETIFDIIGFVGTFYVGNRSGRLRWRMYKNIVCRPRNGRCRWPC
jgi:hypothetical protein